MKRTYAKPVLVSNGFVLLETLSGAQAGNELSQPLVKFNMTEGNLGFYL